MIEDQDFSLEGPPEEAPAPAAKPVAAPLVVIQYRRRGLSWWLLPPSLMLIIAGGVVYIRAQIADWPGLWSVEIRPAWRPFERSLPRPEAPADPAPIMVLTQADPRPEPIPPPAAAAPAAPAAGDVKAVDVGEAASPPGPAEPLSSPMPEMEEVPLTAPAPASPAPGPEDQAPAAIGFDPPGAIRLPRLVGPDEGRPPIVVDAPQADPPRRGPDAEDGPTGPEVWDDIRRAAERERARRQEMETMKPIWLEQDRREAQRRQAEQAIQARRAVEADRPKFRTELQAIVARGGKGAGESIEQLCHQYGRDTLPEVDEAAHKVLEGRAARLRRADRINLLRSCGLPETRILDYLANAESKNILARGGPRNEDEALVRAARNLLAVPLATSRTSTGPAKASSTSRPAVHSVPAEGPGRGRP